MMELDYRQATSEENIHKKANLFTVPIAMLHLNKSEQSNRKKKLLIFMGVFNRRFPRQKKKKNEKFPLTIYRT